MENIYFTRRQRDVLQAMADGYTTYKELSKRLCIAEGTVRTHLHMIYRAAGVNNGKALISAAIRNGWIEAGQDLGVAVLAAAEVLPD